VNRTNNQSLPYNYLSIALVISLLVHLAVGMFFFKTYEVSKFEELTLDATIELPEVLTPPPKRHSEASKQIVTPPLTPSTAAPEESRLLSDKDSSAAKEQIKHGDSPDAAMIRGDNRPPAPKTQTQPQPAGSLELMASVLP